MKKIQTKPLQQEEEISEEQMMQKISFEKMPFLLRYEDYLAVNIPISRNFRLDERGEAVPIAESETG